MNDADRIVHAVLSDELREEVDLAGARMLCFGLESEVWGDDRFDGVELYRCGPSESEWADLVAEPSELDGLPDACFDLVAAVDRSFFGRDDVDAALGEMRRVLVPRGLFLAPALDPVRERLARHFVVRTVRNVDPVTEEPWEVCIGRKDEPPLGAQPPAAAELSGYAYHLSRKSRRRIVFCLDGPLAAGDRLPVKGANGTVGEVTVGCCEGGRPTPAEPWREGFRFPPRATYELDSSLPSGVYTLAGEIPFVHRSERPASVAVLLPSHTGTAFNDAGGRRFYETAGEPPVDVLSFQRPFAPGVLLARCWPFVLWFASANPYPQDTTYLIDSDLEEPDALDGVEVLIVIGRSEYWTRPMRECFDAFVDRGGRALLLCSELMYWQVRVDLARHRLSRYRGPDPHPDPLLRTTVWHDPELRYPVYPRTGCELQYGGNSAEDEGVGWGGLRITCPDSPLLQGSGLAEGDVVPLPDASVWDGAPVESGPDGSPRIDFGDSPPWRHEVVGYNLVKPLGAGSPPDGPATSMWVVLRRTPDAGTVIHCGTMAWCGPSSVGANGPHRDLIRPIILQMLSVLHNDAWPFSSSPEEAKGG